MVQGRYLVVQLIGKGGMGEVYLAVDQRLGSAVALKRTSFAEDANLAAAFEREAKILARLRHPVLPKVSDHFTDGGDQFLVMVHISGDDLSSRLENSGKSFPLSWVMFWADQLLDALSYLHSHEPPIIHRDIKPQNLKLTDENHIVLLDFGLSKDTATLTVSAAGKSGSIVGYTPHFAPMEQIRGTGTNARSDIYSLSATLYQLMTNQVPPDALSRADTMLGSQRDPIKAPSEVNPAVSPAVSEVILKGLEVSQEKRYATASEMQKALRAAYAEIQISMSADTVAFKVGDTAGADLHNTTPPVDTTAPLAPSEMATMVPSQLVTAAPEAVVSAEVAADVPAPAPAVLEAATIISQPKVGEPAPVAEAPATPAAAAAEPMPPTPPTPQAVPVAPVATAPVEELTHETENPELATKLRTPEMAAAAGAGVAAESTPKPAPFVVKTEQPAQAKKKGKSGLVIGGLVGFLLLAGVAGGGGWFAYNKYVKGKVVPTPSPTIAATPTPQQTPLVADANTNSNANTAVGQPTDANSTDANANKLASNAGPKPPPTTKTTPEQKAKPPETKATPKPKANDDRKKIL